jgi:hypothetical protein
MGHQAEDALTVACAVGLRRPRPGAKPFRKVDHHVETAGSVQQAIKSYIADNKASCEDFSSETEDGRKLYEASLRVNGKSRDVTFDQSGQVVLVNKEIALADVPRRHERDHEGGRQIRVTMVEALTENGKQFYRRIWRAARRRKSKSMRPAPSRRNRSQR